MSARDNIHVGHRERLKERYLLEGLDNFNEINALELLLFYSIPRKDTNPLAHRLLAHFGSLVDVLSASAEELMQVDGVTKHTAVFLSLLSDMNRYYSVRQAVKTTSLKTTEDCCKYLIPFFRGRKNETVFLLCLDAKCKVLCCKNMGEGSVNSANISIRKIVETALNANASSVILAHNHPSGVAIPSPEDIQTTKQVAQALKMVEIILADHIVVADDDAVSVTQSEQNCCGYMVGKKYDINYMR